MERKMSTVVWQPKHVEETHMWQFMRFVEKHHAQQFDKYQELHAWSVAYPELFWKSLVDFYALKFTTPPNEVLNGYTDMMEARWFSGATLNFAEQLLLRDDDHPAIVSLDETGQRIVLSHHELRHQVALCAAGLRKAGVKAGDRVAGILPNASFTVIAFLASASIGAIWSSCSTDFGVNAAYDRLGQVEPKVLFVCNSHSYNGKVHPEAEKIKQVGSMMPSLTHIVICPVMNTEIDVKAIPKAIMWEEFLQPYTKLQFTPLPFDHPVFILFSSGTTGKPKCIVHGAGGTLLQHIKELGLHTDIRNSDNLFFYTTCGWMMWNWMVSVLALGATLTLYEGSPTYPDANRLFQLIDNENVTVFGTSAKFISAVEKSGVSPRQKYAMRNLRCILSTASPLLPKNYDFVYQCIKPEVQLSSISGGTDIVSCFALGNPILPVYRGELQCIGLGMKVEVFDENGAPIKEERGELVCTKPFPSMPVGFWNDPDKKLYKHAYFERFPGIWAHGDFAEITSNQGLIIYGRSDAVLNPGGVRIGTAEIYREVEKIPQVIDSIVIGQPWLDDVRVVLFVKLRENITLTADLEDAIRKVIRNNASPRHVPAKILQVGDIPRTISGKIVEIAVRQTVQGEAVNNLGSLANPEALEDYKNRAELQN
jgi:acetoacetyl-CoA synthetase